MISEHELRAQYQARLRPLDLWGQHVQKTVLDRLRVHLSSLPTPRTAENYLKIPAGYRVKDVGSFMTKALHRGKKYTDPLTQITDQVGVRFVVLLSSETEVFNSLINSEPSWTAQQDRDYERERIDHPHSFDYESNHFVVRACPGVAINGVAIPLDTPCEIQIRTLLQHAYAELSHDRLYKPECKVPDKVRRLVARGSALLETTDHMFCEVSSSLERVIAELRASHEIALTVAQERGLPIQSQDPQPSFALLRQWPLSVVSKAQLDDLLQRRDYVIRRMTERQSESLLYAHPVGLLAYLLVEQLGRDAAPHWPFEQDIMDQIAGDLGVGLAN